MTQEVKEAHRSRKLENLKNSQDLSPKLYDSSKQLLGQEEESLSESENRAGS